MSSFLPTQHASFNFFRHFLKIIIAVFLYENVYLDCEKKSKLGGKKNQQRSLGARTMFPLFIFPQSPGTY